jgi:hypothetical protein
MSDNPIHKLAISPPAVQVNEKCDLVITRIRNDDSLKLLVVVQPKRLDFVLVKFLHMNKLAGSIV